MAEYFRDMEGQDVLLFVDNIFRFTQVGTSHNTYCMRLGVMHASSCKGSGWGTRKGFAMLHCLGPG